MVAALEHSTVKLSKPPHFGWIKLYRSSLMNGWLTNYKLWTFWCWCLLKASHKERTQVVGYQQVHLFPGQFTFGRKKAAQELKMSEQEIRTCLYSLRKLKNITIRSTNKYSVISIVNWDIYQSREDEVNQQLDQQLTSNQPQTRMKEGEKRNGEESFGSFLSHKKLEGGDDEPYYPIDEVC